MFVKIFIYKLLPRALFLLGTFSIIMFAASLEICHAAREYKPVGEIAPSTLPAPRSTRADKSAQSQGGSNSRTYISPSGAVKLFGTVEFQRPLNTLPGWLDVLRRNEADPIFIAQKHFDKSTTWARLKEQLSGKTPLEQLRFVNSFWNKWPYREDSANWHQQDYWAIPAQFLKKSGDCEDYAIVKYFTLKELGFDPHKMRLVILRDTIRNLAHAVLVVYTDDDALVLDNLSNVVLSHRRLGNYSPQYSVNEFGRWAHIKGKK